MDLILVVLATPPLPVQQNQKLVMFCLSTAIAIATLLLIRSFLSVYSGYIALATEQQQTIRVNRRLLATYARGVLPQPVYGAKSTWEVHRSESTRPSPHRIDPRNDCDHRRSGMASHQPRLLTHLSAATRLEPCRVHRTRTRKPEPR